MSKALSVVCDSVCLSVCPHDRTKTAEPTITKLGTGIVHHESSSTTEYYVKRSKVRSQGHKVHKICLFVCLSAR